MKYARLCLLILTLPAFITKNKEAAATSSSSTVTDSSRKIFIITLDGFRWQELFNGADSNILADKNFTSDAETAAGLYWAPTAEERRKKLMPFVWNVLASKGRLYGNRKYNNDVDVANLYRISYAGYNEMFTGTTDLTIFSNDKRNNSNENIFEYLDNNSLYKNKIALFTSWELFPYILNRKRNGLEINSGYENVKEETDAQKNFNDLQSGIVKEKKHTREDMLTYTAAREYLEHHRPSVLYVGLGETDEYAHAGNYDMYLQKANEADHLIAELWHWAQTTEGYRNNTTFIITTDHGRGSSAKEWTSHGTFTKGSSQAWLMLMGKGIPAEGEMKTAGQIYQKQLAQTIANMAGEDFGRQQALAIK